MTLHPQLLAVCFSLASVFGTVESVATAETQKYTCRTFGSGVVQPFYGSDFYVRSNCPFTLTRFTHNRVECDITIQRDDSGLVGQLEIIINKIRTVVHNGNIWVEKNRVSLPYDHTYQHIFQYGIYTKLRSSLLPLSVTWHNVLGGIDTLWVELDQELSIDMTGLCGSNVQEKPNCPGDLEYVEKGAAFVPTCTNPNPTISYQDLTSSCVCPKSKVLTDHTEGFQCVSVSSCPCEFAGKSYTSGELRSTKCQSCLCANGKWQCSENMCPSRCLIEGHFVTTFDGKQYVLPGKCTYVASQETYTFSHNMVTVGEEKITELHQTDHALVFWQSSMFVQVHTTLGIKIQVQMFPEIQLCITATGNHTDQMSGLCGNNNNDTTDDFTTSSGIVENSPQPFALSWSFGDCAVNIPPSCIKTDYEIFADDKCSVLNLPNGIFAECHAHIPTDHFYKACILRTCNCGSSLQQCLCVALGSYVKACASLGVEVGDWRKATNCTVECQNNQEFSYNIPACNRTCGSLSGPDPRCELDDAPVEGCGCPEGTHLKQGHICTPKAECDCHFHGGTTPPGSVVIDGRMCSCDNGELHCSKDCGCRNGKVCVHCSEDHIKTAQKTCDSLNKPMGGSMTCESGCYCPYDQYEDHRGNCVPLDECTCVYSGKVFSEGQSVKTNCKTCICGQGQWHCKDEPCSGTCQVYGNGHYQTFDSKWYRFDGNCQYTLVEDDCGKRNSTFSVRVESVPCCDEALTCSRSIIIDLQGKVTLTLSDMRVTRHYHVSGTQEGFLYSMHTVGLYIIISVPSKGITLIWDKHTRITVELSAYWKNKVCGLCGNFDSNEMNDLQIIGSEVMSSPVAFGNSWKAAAPPCSDVTTEIFPCERNSYCAAWAERRCMIITGDIFKECHYKVDPEPYFHACVQESCSCEFEGKFLGFCTAVAAYAEACSDHDVCVNWRTPDLCPVYCDYYNEKGQCSWHYEACGQMLTCGRRSLTHKLEGRCDLYGDPHYITFQGVPFDFLDDCSYILVEERSPRLHLMIAVDNFFCIPGLKGSCVKGIILKYQNSTARLRINPPLLSVQATLNNMTIEPPYEEHGWRFEVTGYIVSIYLPEIRSYVSLSPSYNLVINLAMEHFLNNTQGQCGVCGGGNCIRKGGLIEDDSCCEKTAYDWVYDDPQKPACFYAPRDVPCHPSTTVASSTTPSHTTHTTSCPASLLCELLHHPVFSNCSQLVNLNVQKKNCEFDSCRTGACSSLEQAAEECKRAGFCIDWRRLTNGICDWTCQEGLVFRECHNKLDDFCYKGVQQTGASLENNSAGCFCPSGLIRMGNHSNVCVSECPCCKGPLGEPRLPGEMWQSGCYLCTCNNRTQTEECFRKPLGPPPTCGPDAELFNTSCCGEPTCVEKTCIYNGTTYKVGDRWKDAANPCMSFTCHKDGIQTETKVCPIDNCQEEDRICDDQQSCITCNQSCSPKLTSINITIDNCTTIMQMSVCQGQCVSQPRIVYHGDLQVEQKYKCCQERSSERRSVTLQCFDLSARSYAYKHITSCECRACDILS
ncbi:mucin-6 [Tautogolabrus adspersus]